MRPVFWRTRVGKAGAALAGVAALAAMPGLSSAVAQVRGPAPTTSATTTPIRHLVVIFQENVSFDHYFGTYPKAANTSGRPFDAAPRTPRVNNLANTPGLLTANPNGVNPRRYDPANVNDVLTCDQGHNYDAEQKAFDGGKMDKFPGTVGNGSGNSATGQPCNAGDVMNYYDGNTVTGLWNYAQRFAMSDNSYSSTFGPSSPGAINLVAGDTGGVSPDPAKTVGKTATVPDGKGGLSLIGDSQPFYDDCSTRDAVTMTGKNVGDELNAAGVSWGWFQGGFRPTTTFAAATKLSPQPTNVFIPDQFSGKFATAPASNQGLCNAVHPIGAGIGGTGGYGWKDDYIPHHEPFQYYASTANPHHLAPASLAAIGTDTQTMTGGPQFDTANHQYDASDFDALVGAIARGYISPDHLPAVSFLKAPGYQDGHAFYSDPLDEQQFVANEVNALQHTPDWSSTAVVIAYDDSDGWYDHAFSGVHNPSNTSTALNPPNVPVDFLNGDGLCGPVSAMPLDGENGRCGYGPRQPLLVISPWARHNFVDHTLTDQGSILKFVEDNWTLQRSDADSFATIAGSLNKLFSFGNGGGKNGTLFLDPITGQPLGA